MCFILNEWDNKWKVDAVGNTFYFEDSYVDLTEQ